ncbi:expressed unknown protein [Seminavis robusta]|uniref:Uncharacterized protein n=1 Tax=Seminavis robusta TaxID=568900 RepID=A0A9N8DWB9_9STRA|nr:expressed unknown protein [Seminavis robusta]|eukprot:Sro296_g110620.1 n/a (301) ;mRNA; r:16582-17484
MGPYEDPCLDANTTALAELSPLLKKGSTLVLNYDYGTTTKHTFTVLSTKTVKDQRVDCFPRRKPEPLRYFKPFRIHEIYLDAEYAALDHWIFEREGCTQVNLFQPGRKHCYGYLENESISEARMIYVADKPQSLNHYLDCLNVAARIKKGSSYSWHSVVVLPEGSKKIDKYCQDLKEGFIDCAVVEHNNDDDDADIPTLVKAFPKLLPWLDIARIRQSRRVGFDTRTTLSWLSLEWEALRAVPAHPKELPTTERASTSQVLLTRSCFAAKWSSPLSTPCSAQSKVFSKPCKQRLNLPSAR